MSLQNIIENQLNKLESLDKFLDRKADEYFQKKCLPILTMQKCIDWGKEMQAQNYNIAKIIVDVEENEQPTTSNDILQVTVAALDSENKPICKKGEDALAVVLFAGTIDKKLIDFLDGAYRKIYKL